MPRQSDIVDEVLERIREQLKAEFRRVGHGSKKKTMDALGLSRAALDQAFHRKSLKIEMLARVVDNLGVPFEVFICRAFGLRHPTAGILDILRLDLESEGALESKGLAATRRRFRREDDGD